MTPPRVSVVLALAVWALVVLGWVWFVPAPTAAALSATSRDDNWNLPLPAATGLDVDRAAVAASRLWGNVPAGLPLPAATVVEALTPADWRISGVYTDAGQSGLVVSVPGKPDRMLRIGDSLPGGARIVAISADRIGIVLQGQRLSLNIYRE